MQVSFRVLAAAALLAGAVGCHDHDHDDHPKDEHACEHFANGPEANVEAGAERGDAPEGYQEHTLIIAALTGIDGGNGGFLRLTIPKAGTYRLLTGSLAPVVILPAGSDTPLAARASGEPEGCDRAARVHVFALPAGAHTLSIGPTSEETFPFVLEEERDHGHKH